MVSTPFTLLSLEQKNELGAQICKTKLKLYKKKKNAVK